MIIKTACGPPAVFHRTPIAPFHAAATCYDTLLATTGLPAVSSAECEDSADTRGMVNRDPGGGGVAEWCECDRTRESASAPVDSTVERLAELQRWVGGGGYQAIMTRCGVGQVRLISTIDACGAERSRL
jgi:hypothetical protein